MGAIFFLVFLIVLLTIGMVALISGIVLLCIARAGMKKENRHRSTVTILSVIFLCIGVPLILLPLSFLGFIVYVNTVPPDDFVQTAIVIEEDGYQDVRFTADGVVYEVLPLAYGTPNEPPVAVFSYYTEGFLNGAQCGNYYAVKNAGGFDLITDSYALLFCPVEQKDEVVRFYTEAAARISTRIEMEDTFPLDASTTDAFIRLHETLENTSKAQLITREISYDRDPPQLWIETMSEDGAVWYFWDTFILLDGTAYATVSEEFLGDATRYTLLPVPEEHQALLCSMFEE